MSTTRHKRRTQKARRETKKQDLIARDPDANHRKRRKSGSGIPKYTPERAKAFCVVLADTANVTKAALTLNLTRMTVYNWRERHPEFKDMWDTALEVGIKGLEDEAIRRGGNEGVKEPVFYKGVVVGSVTKYSDTLLTFLLAAHMPERYGKQRTELTGKDGTPLMPVKMEIEFVKPKGAKA